MPPVEHMKTSLEHLPDDKQAELKRVQEILFEEFDDAQKLATTTRKKAGRILKIILFGSYARPDVDGRPAWVDELDKTSKGYQSDYDVLVVVNHKDLTDVATYWYKAEDRIIREIRTPVGLIYHTIEEVNDKLRESQYFFTDIVKEGIVLYELPGHRLSEPGPQTPQQALERAEKYLGLWFVQGLEFFDTYSYNLKLGRERTAAFQLHQAVENLYTCYLLTTTFYSPSTHNIARLRSLAEDRDERFRDVWPRENKFQRRSFERLKDAYVKARYSEHYVITQDELVWLGERTCVLRDVVKAACEERVAELKAKADEAAEGKPER